jgi:hypothetical protein
MKKYFLFIVIMFSVISKVASQCQCGGAAMIMSGETTNGSVSLKRNSWMVEGAFEAQGFKTVVEETHTHSHSHSHAEDSAEAKLKSVAMASANIRYGITKRLTLSIQQSQIWLNATPQNSKGRGDLLTFITYRFLDKNDFSVAVIGGIKLPTGTRSALGSENQLIIGTGSYDPVTGVNLALSKKKITLRLNGFYKYAGTGFDKTSHGNLFSHSVLSVFKLKDGSVCSTDSISKKAFTCSIFSSLTGELYGRRSVNNVVQAESGGYLLLAGAGIQFGNRKWSFPVSASWNVYEHMNSDESGNKFRVRASVIRTF